MLIYALSISMHSEYHDYKTHLLHIAGNSVAIIRATPQRLLFYLGVIFSIFPAIFPSAANF